MPARVVDGEGVWKSKKIKLLPLEFRGEYANLVPLAEANGVFDCDPETVWAEVYAFNRPDISVEVVRQLLARLEEVDLLRTWTAKGKRWGYWTGIHKSGRLPTDKHLVRYKNLPPNPPPEVLSDADRSEQTSGSIPDNPGPIPESPAWFGMDWIGLDRCGAETAAPSHEHHGQEDQVKATKEIPILAQAILGKKVKLYDEQACLIRNLEAEHKGSAVINAFGRWAKEHRYDDSRNPIKDFLEVAEDYLGGGSGVEPVQAKASEANKLARELAFIGDGKVTFDDKQKKRLEACLGEFSFDELVSAFREYLRSQSDNDLPFAAKKFSESADQLAENARRRKDSLEKQAAQIESETERLAREAAAERARLPKVEEEVEETLGGGA